VPFAQIEPTTRCNYSCGFCAGRHMVQADLDFGVFERFLQRIEHLEHIELQGEGEPLLHPRFFDMVAAAQVRFPGVAVSMITNGSLFTARNVDHILDHGIHRIFVSMESADERRFRDIRGGTLDRVRRGIIALLEARERRGAKVPVVGIAVTVLRETVNELFDTIAPLYRQLGLDGGITVQPLQSMPQYVRFYAPAMMAQQIGTMDETHFAARMRAAPEVVRMMQARSHVPGFYEMLYASTGGRNVCPWLENGLYVARDGVLLSCCFIKDSTRFALGNVESPSRQVLARRQDLADRLAIGETPGACTGCAVAEGIVRHGRHGAAMR